MPALAEVIHKTQNPYDPFPSVPVVPVKRRSGMTAEKLNEFLQSPGSPVIITDSARAWPRPHSWSFDYLTRIYGERRLVATPNLISYEDSRRVRLRDFTLYCQAPSLSPLSTYATEMPLYVSFPIRQKFPELMKEFSLPPFIENIYDPLLGELREWYLDTFAWIYMGPRHTVTPLHVDQFMTHTLSAQVAGRKKFLLFSPEILGRIAEPGPSSLRDVFSLTECLADAPLVIHETVVEEGEMLIFPAGWAHHVVSLEPAISVSVNFVAQTNVLAHLMMISRQLPAWARRTHTAGFRAANRCEWSSKNFSAFADASS